MRHNLLYGITFCAILSGCGGVTSTSVPVEEPRQVRVAPRSVVPGSSVPAPSTAPAQRAAPEQSEMLFRVLTSIGVDYRYGGNSHATGFDCSGLVAHVFREGYGINLPRTSTDQAQVGQPVSADDLKPGDLVFYNTLNKPYSHVGIYLGDGRFIHAPKTGSAVRIESLKSGYWLKRWNGGRRIDVRA